MPYVDFYMMDTNNMAAHWKSWPDFTFNFEATVFTFSLVAIHNELSLLLERRNDKFH